MSKQGKITISLILILLPLVLGAFGTFNNLMTIHYIQRGFIITLFIFELIVGLVMFLSNVLD